jgi:transcriptional regulator with PAS, ATPase and Fis domain
MNYSLEIASSSHFFENTLSYETSTKNQLNTVMDFIDYSIIILNNNHVILNYNKNLLQMFDLRDTLLNKNIAEVPEIRKLAQHIDDENMINKLIEINENKRILITVRVLKDSLLKSNSYLILMRDVTDVMKLEGTLKKQMEKRGYTTKYNFLNIYGKGREIKDCVEKAKIFGKLDKNVLIVGESGTGKELFAHSMHDYSPRKNYPFIGINCAALPSTLLESELFGYEEGTFTGAKKGGKRGLFELANNGTLFLDEIGDMTIETQTKILRVLEEKEFMRLGSGEIISINVRIMAATNKDLRELINEGLFRLDLYYRLNTYMLKIPPLRNRKGDIEYLIRMFIEEESKTPVSIDEDAINFLVNCNWYGNVRELKNCIEYMVTISKGGPINMSHIPDYIMEEHEELNKHIFAPQGDVLYELNGREKDIAFLIMSEIFKTSCGRRKIYEVLRKTYPDLTEYKLRMIINILAEKNLIRQGTGRRGMSLTDKGLKYIGE